MPTNSPRNSFRHGLLVIPMLALFLVVGTSGLPAQEIGRLTYLSENNPWYPHTEFPKLTTPQWVGEEGVEAVVVLAIDDMRDSAKYEGYLRPILQRLKQIDGRAPVSIMTCKAKPDDQRIQTWLDEGLSIEVHTIDHPCPLLHDGDFASAKSTYDRCVDLLTQIPRSGPVAFRMPCCDSLNTVSPRFFSEIFDPTTENGHYLQISSSVFNVFTSKDRTIPRELVFDAKGRERFLKYVPHQSHAPPKFRFNNLIENYPYPYVVNRTCWEFPCVVPSDWEAQHLHKPNNPLTVTDMQAALDITVHKQGVFCLVFHPHGWIRNDQVVELIDHAVKKHGKKVKFLTFPEALSRVNRHLLNEEPLRDEKGRDNGVRLVDVNQDGFLDVIIGNEGKQQTRIWQPRTKAFLNTSFLTKLKPDNGANSCQFVTGIGSGNVQFVCVPRLEKVDQKGKGSQVLAKTFQDGKWVDHRPLAELFAKHIQPNRPHPEGTFKNILFHEVSDHGSSLALVTRQKAVETKFHTTVFWWSAKPGEWQKLRANIPAEVAEALAVPGHPRLRFVDLNEDGDDDFVLSPRSQDGQSGQLKFWLVNWFATGKATELHLADSISTMPIVRMDGSDNGFFVRDRHLCWQNEDTNKLPDLLHRVAFDKILAQHASERAKQGQLPPPRTPEQSAAMIQMRPGFRVELVAAEPLIRDPVAFDWDTSGRLWVVEMGGYPNGTDGQGQGGGRVQILTDTDRDGRYDKAQTFLEGLNFPTGIQLWREGAIITAAPEILYAEDTDGDGKADIRKTLYRGFVEGNQQHRVNGLRWGLDNWLYVANGDSGGTIEAVAALGKRDPVRSKPLSISGRDLRIRPDEGRIDPQSGQSQFGRNRDDWGNWFGCNNSHPMWHYALADHYLRRNPHATVRSTRYEVPAIPSAAPVFPVSPTLPRYNDFHTANRFTSACSTMIYRDQLFGDAFYGNAFVSEPVHNLVSRLVLKRDGNTFTGSRAPDELDSEFLASRDNWFRPTMLRTGPDGALWVADMYRAVIEHPKWIPADWQEKLNLRAGQEMGRIYKVIPESAGDCCRPIVKSSEKDSEERLRCFVPDRKLSTTQLVDRLASPSGWWRDTAQRLLLHRQDALAIPLLKTMVRNHQNPLARLHALCTLDGLEGLTSEVLLSALEDSHPFVRLHAVRLSGPHAADDQQLVKALVERLDDDDAMVQMQLAYTAGELPKQSAGRILAALLRRKETNPWLTAAALSSLNTDNIPEVLKQSLTSGDNATLDSGLLATLLGQAAAFGRIESIKAPLRELLPQSKEPFSPAKWKMLAMVVSEIQGRTKIWREIIADESLKTRWAMAQNEALRLLTDRQADLKTRVATLRLIGVGGIPEEKTRSLLEKFLVPQTPNALQVAVVETLVDTGHLDVPGRLFAGWRGHSPALRAAILDALLERQHFRGAILEAIVSDSIAAVDVDTVRRERLLRTGSMKDQQRAAKLFSASTTSNRQAVIDQFAPVLKMQGNAVQGRQVFQKRCAACHKLDGIGKSVGADLAALKDRSTGAMLTAILDPNRAIEAKFLSFTAATTGGRTYAGMLLTETGTSITLIGGDGKEHTIRRADLEVLKGSNRSLMPEGFEKDLTLQDLADVIRFVQSSANPRKEFPGNKPRTITPNAEGGLKLPASAAEIFGPSIVFEPKFENLGFWSSAEDHADWTIRVPDAGRYEIVLDYAVHKSAAGEKLQLAVGKKTLRGTVPSTGDWENYQEWKLGTMEIPAGIHRLVVATPTKPRTALIDLRAILLKPIGKKRKDSEAD